MTASAIIRAVGQDDPTAIEKLGTDDDCMQWGGLGRLTAQALIDRWQEPKVTGTFIQVADTDSGLEGYSDVYRIPANNARFHGIATNPEVAALLIDWTRDKAVSQGISLQTSLSTVEDGRTIFRSILDHPLHSLLESRGFHAFSTTRVMRLRPDSASELPTFPRSYRLAAYDASLLSLLMATYYVAWPEDYFQNEDRSSIEDIFRDANSDDLRLVISDGGDVVGYVLLSRSTEHGEIDEVAVHPSHRRQGLGEALTRWAIQSLGDRTISLVVMDENPARNIYERLGFFVWEERLDLALSCG